MLNVATSLVIIFLCLPVVAIGAVIHVPGKKFTFQAGIGLDFPGDTVLVADGVYMGYGNKGLIFPRQNDHGTVRK